MFIKNPSSINNSHIIHVNTKEKENLILNGYIPLSYQNGKWIFIVNDHILQILSSQKGG